MFTIALVPSVLLAVGMAFSPESPRWLYQVTNELHNDELLTFGGGFLHEFI